MSLVKLAPIVVMDTTTLNASGTTYSNFFEAAGWDGFIVEVDFTAGAATTVLLSFQFLEEGGDKDTAADYHDLRAQETPLLPAYFVELTGSPVATLHAFFLPLLSITGSATPAWSAGTVTHVSPMIGGWARIRITSAAETTDTLRLVIHPWTRTG